MINAKIIADSINNGNRITTMVVTFPRIILAEFNTHRMFSRNSASSRAIPFEKMVKSIEENPFIPIAWQKDHKGMQGTEYCTTDLEIEANKKIWLRLRDKAVQEAINLSCECSVTKQLCNRLLESFMWHTVIVTATEWENFFKLRCPQYWLGNPMDTNKYRSRKDAIKALTEQGFSPNPSFDTWDNVQWLKFNGGQAEIHMMALAEAMWDALNESIPKELQAGEWHIPFGEGINGQKLVDLGLAPSDLYEHELEGTADDSYTTKLKVKIATAMCARVSYTVVGEEEKEPNYDNDIKLHDRLLESGHMSPFEHCAQAPTPPQLEETGWSGNFKGWIQYRKMIENK